MTDAEIKEASRLIDEIASLEEAGLVQKDDTLVICRTTRSNEVSIGYRPYIGITGISNDLAKEVIGGIIARKKARLNDLRSGC
jgi:hypothetical protein